MIKKTPKSASPSPFRIEKDSLGEVNVPRDAFYGAQTARALENFPISGKQAHPALVRAYLRLKLAAVRANLKARALRPQEEALIQKAIKKLLAKPTEWTKHFPVDPYQAGAGTSQNMNFNEVIAHVANSLAPKPKKNAPQNVPPIHPNDHVNCSQSTNDTYPTAMRLALLDASAPLLKELRALAQSFERKAKKWDRIPKSGRTHLQDAVPIRLGQEFSGYAATLQHCVQRLEQGRDELRELGIGASAVGTGINVPRGYRGNVVRELEALTREKLFPAQNLFELTQSQAAILAYSSALRILAIEVGRICNDLRLLSSGPATGLAEIYLPTVQPGSSIMPGKVNPSILEMVNQTCFSILGYDHSVALAVQAGQLELNVMMPIMSYSLLEATQIATHSLHILRLKCIDGLEPNLAKLKQYFESTSQIATALSPKLGYEKTAHLVQEALAKNKSLLTLVKEKKLLKDKDLKDLTDFRALTGGL